MINKGSVPFYSLTWAALGDLLYLLRLPPAVIVRVAYIASDNDIHVHLKLTANAVPHRIKKDPHPFSTREFESWHEVAVAGNYNYSANKIAQGEARNIQSNPQIDTFLLDIRNDVRGL